MSTRLTLFTATLIQDSALSVSGIDRESSADQPFSLVDGVPTLSGRGLKGVAVAMARRFFDPFPRSVSENPKPDVKRVPAYRRSAWEFANATPENSGTTPRLRAGVGIRHKTGARAGGVLYDREIVPAGTRWPLVFRVDWPLAGAEAIEAEGILGCVLARHWSAGRCWLGGGVARGLGWCHVESLRAYRLDSGAYDRWVESGRERLPDTLAEVPIVEPTRSWCFRTLDLKLPFGEYRPITDEPAWGLDMLAIGSHDSEQTLQVTSDGDWARPSWADATTPKPTDLVTDRAIVMDRGRPLLPGSSLRGPLRHAFSRAKVAARQPVQDPHLVHGDVGKDDPAGRVFGTVKESSRVLIRDGRAEAGWAAARLHMHAEDEFSAGSYGSSKRDAVRVLRGVFSTRIVVEGPDVTSVEALTAEINRLIALGELGHLPLGGHKTRGAGWSRWQAKAWIADDVVPVRSWAPQETAIVSQQGSAPRPAGNEGAAWIKWRSNNEESAHVRVTGGVLDSPTLTLGEAAALARGAFGGYDLAAWWCEPAIDLAIAMPPAVFGHHWPDGETIRVEEAAFYADCAVWRVARTGAGSRWVLVEEVGSDEPGAHPVSVIHTPARLHGSTRFAALRTDRGPVRLKEWHVDGQLLGFTLVPEER